jgi:hypothetical protein
MKKYVTEFDSQLVPVGSKYYSKADINQKSYFYNSERWPVGDKSTFVIHNSDLKELPEAKWMPVVGEECEVWHGEDWLRCLFVGKGFEDNYIYQLTEQYRLEINGDIDLKAFRPLKSSEELRRGAFIDNAARVMFNSDNRVFVSDASLGALFDAGYAAPKE